MKRPILLTIGVIMALITGYVAFSLTSSKRHSPPGLASYENNGLAIEVTYSRPYKKGRVLFGEPGSTALEVYGEPWRTGANEATQIKINKDIVFNEGMLEAGEYSMYTIPGKKEWIIAFNSKLNYWGASVSGNPFDPTLDVLRVKVPRQKNEKVIEQFTIDFHKEDDKVGMLLLWDDIRVEIPLETKG